MSSIEALKEQARSHEQREEWRKALSLYLQAIERLEEEDQPDIGLYNRVGDLYIRLGESDRAFSHYEEAVDLYVDAELPNNAIAVCKKIIRNVPDRHRPYLRMGQIRASQGFIVDARTNFLTYAERMQGDGEYDEAFRALTEFADLVPDDTEVRLLIAEQMANHERVEEGVEQLVAGYRAARDRGDDETMAVFEERLGELAPELDLDGLIEESAGGDDAFAFESTALGGEDAVAYGGVSFDAPADTEGHETGGSIEREESEGVEPAGAAGPAGPDPALFGSTEAGVPTAPDDGAEIGDGAGEDDESLAASSFPSELPGERAGEEAEGEWGVVELPRESASEEAREVPEEDIGGELPMLSFDEDDDDEAEEDIGDELPMLTFDDEPAYEESGSAAAEEEVAADAGPGGDGGEERIGGDLPLLAFGDVFADEDPEVDQSATVDAGGEDASEAGEEESVEPAEAVDGEAAEPAEPMDGEAAVEEVEEAREEAVAEARQEAVAGTREDEAGLAPPAASPREELEALRERLQESPDEVELHQRAVELAFRAGDDELLARAYADLGHALQRNGDEARARAVFQQALDLDPELEDARAAILEGDAPSAAVKEVTSSEDYVDLGAMILGDEADEEKTTRFRVAYEAPSGDEDADFARMLSQFKAKVAENFDTEDVKGHHDLGTAYKEMGLLDEAIEEFQAALRASADHLPTYELLGQVFLEQGNADAALRVLKRAQDTRWQVEDELIGIYYYTARAHEELGQRSDAVEYYDRVFSMDINFADVTDRLRELR